MAAQQHRTLPGVQGHMQGSNSSSAGKPTPPPALSREVPRSQSTCWCLTTECWRSTLESPAAAPALLPVSLRMAQEHRWAGSTANMSRGSKPAQEMATWDSEIEHKGSEGGGLLRPPREAAELGGRVQTHLTSECCGPSKNPAQTGASCYPALPCLLSPGFSTDPGITPAGSYSPLDSRFKNPK